MSRINYLLERVLELSESLRPGYLKSVGSGVSLEEIELRFDSIFPTFEDKPLALFDIYFYVTGTKCDISDQKYMDFIPGYRLIHFDEIEVEYRKYCALGLQGENLFPFLTNYSSDYICVSRIQGESCIYSILHDDPTPILMHKTLDRFLETIIKFYERDVYFVDNDGFLDFNFEDQGILGAELNPELPYWFE